MNSLSLVVCAAGLLAAQGCGSHHISLQSAGTFAAGNAQNCSVKKVPADPASNCRDIDRDVPADQNQGGTVFIPLPDSCKGRIHRIVIHDAGSSAPVAYVECALDTPPVTSTRPSTNR